MKNIKKKNVRFVLLMAIVISLLTMPLIASAHIWAPYKLDKSKTLTFVPQNTFGATSISHFNEALSQWNSATGYTLMTRSTSTHSETAYPKADGKSYIYRINAGAKYAAECQPYLDSTGKIVVSADINFNTYYAWANSAQPGCMDVWTVFLHESGHPAGLSNLEDTSHLSSVMYIPAAYNATKRYLSGDDTLAIKARYPK